MCGTQREHGAQHWLGDSLRARTQMAAVDLLHGEGMTVRRLDGIERGAWGDRLRSAELEDLVARRLVVQSPARGACHVCLGDVADRPQPAVVELRVGKLGVDARSREEPGLEVERRAAEAIHASLELARTLGYKLYVSGILGLAGTTLRRLREEVEHWLSLAETYQDSMTALAVSLPGVIPGSRMYWELYQSSPEVRGWHGEIVPCRRLTETFIARNTEVRLADVEAAVQDVARGVLGLAANGRNPLKFGGYMLGGKDETEAAERALLDERIARLA